jgi:diguanylate cyclase (GGDEF)-like protein
MVREPATPHPVRPDGWSAVDAVAPSRGASTSPAAGAVTDVLAKILEAAPFGVEIAQSGRTLYANAAHQAGTGHGAINGSAASENQVIRTRHFNVSCGSGTYEVSLSTNEAEQAAMERALIQKAWFDELTGLPNRSLIERSVSALIESEGTPFGLVFIDLDSFKHVNDYYGHAVGDELLRRLAERLSAGLRQSDLLARLSGDEFALLISPIADFKELTRDVEWISERIKEPFIIDGQQICTSASIGVSIFPEHGGTYDLLLSNADRAMYRGKSSVKGSVSFFDSSIEHAAAQRNREEQRLRFAIRDKRVCCAYQPKVDLRSGKVLGVEVLMRWKDEDGIIQPPGKFLGLATELGLMDDLTLTILAETVASIDRINDAFGRDCSISINVAAHQASDLDFMRSLVVALDATGLADRFMVELTEEAFLAKSEFQTNVLPMLRAIGSRVSIDDFGIGYSSLSALADITADELKVDRSFISEVHRRPRSQSILKAIEALGHSLGMAIVVEGVETFEELLYLQSATRITCGQGHYFCKPLLLGELRTAMASGSEVRPPLSGRDPSLNRTTEWRARTG